MFSKKNVLAYVFIMLFSAIHAQNPKTGFLTLSMPSVNFKPQDVNFKLSKQKPFLITFEQHQTSIPKYFQFTCDGNEATLTLQISITDGVNVQAITKDVKIDSANNFYEVAILPRNKNDISLNSNSYIKSIFVVNNINQEVNIGTCNFSNVSIKNEVNINQVFMVDLDADVKKQYVVFSKETKIISMNVYKINGDLEERLMYTLNSGENYLDFSLIKKSFGKKVIQLSEDLLKKPSNKLSVMY